MTIAWCCGVPDTRKEIAGETRRSLVQRMVDGWVEEEKAQGAARLRAIEASSSDPEYGRQA